MGDELRASLNHFGRVAPQIGWRMEDHVHPDFNELILVVSGTLEVLIHNERLLGQRGDILTYPCRAWHAERAVTDEPLETLFVAWQWRDSRADIDWPLLANDHDGRMQGLVYWMYELFPPTQSADQHMLDVLLDALLFEAQHLGQTREQQIVARVKTFVQNHITESLCLDDLAAAAGFSRYYFCREFKKAAGVTPMAFVRHVRVEATRSLLLSTSWTLKAIAQQVGFSDEFQLSRIFKRVTGTTPTQVRSGDGRS